MSETEPHVFIHSLPQINTLLYGNYYCQCLQIPLCVLLTNKCIAEEGSVKTQELFYIIPSNATQLKIQLSAV